MLLKNTNSPHIIDNINYIQHKLHFLALHLTAIGFYLHLTSALVISVIPVNGVYYDHWFKGQTVLQSILGFITII